MLVADLLADIEHRRLVALALADHDGAIDGKRVEFAAHGIDRRLVRRLLVAAAPEPRRRHRRAFGDANELDRKHALDRKAWLDGNRRRHSVFPGHFWLSPVQPSLRAHARG